MRKRRVLCVGVNPAFDITLELDGLDADRVNRVIREQRQAAGKAANVACVLESMGVPVLLTGCYGADTLDQWAELFAARSEEIGVVPVVSRGSTRQNITLLAGGNTVKINRSGDAVDSDAYLRLAAVLKDELTEGDIAVFTGSIPPGMTVSDYIGLMKQAEDMGALVVLDTDALSLDEVLAVRPWLYKPNAHELAKLCGISSGDDGALIACAQELVRGGVEIVLLTLGSRGLAAVTGKDTVRVSAEKVVAVNTVGAGDAALAAYVAEYLAGSSREDCARAAARAGEKVVSAPGQIDRN